MELLKVNNITTRYMNSIFVNQGVFKIVMRLLFKVFFIEKCIKIIYIILFF